MGFLSFESDKMSFRLSVSVEFVPWAFGSRKERPPNDDGEGSTEPSRVSQDQVSAHAKQKIELYGSLCLFLARLIDFSHAALPHLIALVEQLLG